MLAIRRVSHGDISALLAQGAVGGVIAGAVMGMVEMVWAAAAGMGFWLPARMIASVPLGTMPPEIPLSTAIPVFLVTHMVLSMMFGLAFAALLALVPALRASAVATVVAASLFGLMLWLLNFYVIAPALDRPWFTDAEPIQQFVAHTFAFGAVLGLYLVAVSRRDESGI